MTEILTRLLGRLPIGWLQLMHNKTRLLAAVGGVVFANVLIFMQLGFMSALFVTSVLTHRSFNADIVIASSDFHAFREANPIPRARMYQALASPGVVAATPIYAGQMQWTDPETGDTMNFRVLGVSPDEPVFSDPELQRHVAGLAMPDTAVVDWQSRGFNLNIKRRLDQNGEERIEMNGRQITLTGSFAQGASFDVDGAFLVSDQTFFRLFPESRPGAPTVVLVRCAPGSDLKAIVAEINSRIPEPDARAMTHQEFIDAEHQYQAQQTPIGFVFGFGVAIGVLVGLMIVYQVLTTDVQDHLPEYATLKAIGYSHRWFLGIVFEEAICLAIMGFIPGLLISGVLYRVTSTATALPVAMTLGRPPFVLLLTIVMCGVSGAIATRKLAAADPADLF